MVSEAQARDNGAPPTGSATGLFGLRAANAADVAAIVALLEAAGMPAVNVEDIIPSFLVAETGADLVGCAALEVYDRVALVRSVAIADGHRRGGVGRSLVTELERRAAERALDHLYLFTIDAWPFWQRLGYVGLAIEQWPEGPRQSWQYRHVSTHREEFRAIGMRSMHKPLGEGQASHPFDETAGLI